MRNIQLTLPELGMVAATRGLLGAGIGMLAGDRLEPAPRRAVGWTLFIIGALSTIPLVIELIGKTDKLLITSNSCRSLNHKDGEPEPVKMSQ